MTKTFIQLHHLVFYYILWHCEPYYQIHCQQYNASNPHHYHVFFNITHSTIWIITLIALKCNRLMSFFNMFTQMMHLKFFLITLITLICTQLMSVFNKCTEMMDLICFFITFIVQSIMDHNFLGMWIFVITFFTFMCRESHSCPKLLCSSVTTH